MQDQKLWTWHLAAGLVILVLLGLHMAIMHLDAALGIFNPSGGHPIDWANVVARGQTLFFSVTYVLLLGVALFHGLYGLRNIFLELAPGPGLKTAISWLLIITGVALFVLGTWAAWKAHQVALGGVLVKQPVVEVPWVARQGSAFAGKAGRGMRCGDIGDEAQRRMRAQTPGALRVTGGLGPSAALRSLRHRHRYASVARLASGPKALVTRPAGLLPRAAQGDLS